MCVGECIIPLILVRIVYWRVPAVFFCSLNAGVPGFQSPLVIYILGDITSENTGIADAGFVLHEYVLFLCFMWSILLFPVIFFRAVFCTGSPGCHINFVTCQGQQTKRLCG